MIQINAKQQKLQFVKNGPVEYRYVMHVNQYSKLSESKVLDEASAHSGIGKGALKGAWDAIGDVIRAWVTEGHSVAIPGLGTIRFSVQAKAVADVNDVAKNLITSRKAVFTPSSDILATLRGTRVQITCIDKDGNIVKRVQDDATNETLDDGDDTGNGGGTTPTPDTPGGGGNNGDNGGGDGDGNGSDE
jgi:predicted histone-like DNA-binding protein